MNFELLLRILRNGLPVPKLQPHMCKRGRFLRSSSTLQKVQQPVIPSVVTEIDLTFKIKLSLSNSAHFGCITVNFCLARH